MVWSCYLVCMVCYVDGMVMLLGVGLECYVDGMVMLLACGTGVLC